MQTLSGPASFEQVIRKSRFIAHAARVDDLAATLAFYESVADSAANHNCWAWKLGHQYRSNDDGEPGGSAGRPILAAMEGKGLDHVMVVVTRYFGGIKLGVGGLIRAYGGCAARCLDAANVASIEPSKNVLIRAGFEWSGAVHGTLEAAQALTLNTTYRDDGLEILATVSESQVDTVRTALRDATRGAAKLSVDPEDS